MAFGAEITLTSNNDTFTGQSISEKIFGMEGNDIINGGGGDDEIFGDGSLGDFKFTNPFAPPGNDTLHGGDGKDTLHGGDGNDNLFGDGGNDTLFGDGGNDRLDGGSGADIMHGGGGNDVYVVDNVGDVVQDDLLFGGTDRVESSISYDLRNAENVENLTLTGSSNINGTGDSGDNVITGNSGDNVLSGREGNDTLNGGDGNDRLDGGIGNDILNGGNGNDTFVINASSDTDTINGGNGSDTVESSISFSLASSNVSNVENLTLTGSGNINGTGNDANNSIEGNDAANTLKGGNGNDALDGNGGNDTLNGDGGNDLLAGGSGNDTLNGGADNDILSGGQGLDRYNGGSGNDTLQFDAADFDSGATDGQYDGGTGIDTIQMGLSGSTILDLRTIDNRLIHNVEVIDLQTDLSLRNGAVTFTNHDQVFLSFDDVIDMTDDQNTLRIDGDAGDQVTFIDNNNNNPLWHESDQQQTIGNQVYDVYTNGQATLLVDHDIQVDGSFV